MNTHLDGLSEDFTIKEKESIKALLIYLFPRLKDVYHSHVYTNRTETELYKNMRIGSLTHFNRFFSYTVIKGDLSDIAFKNFLSEVSEQSVQTVADKIKELVTQSSTDNFLIKIRSFEEDYNWNVAKKIANGIVTITEIFPNVKSNS